MRKVKIQATRRKIKLKNTKVTKVELLIEKKCVFKNYVTKRRSWRKLGQHAEKTGTIECGWKGMGIKLKISRSFTNKHNVKNFRTSKLFSQKWNEHALKEFHENSYSNINRCRRMELKINQNELYGSVMKCKTWSATGSDWINNYWSIKLGEEWKAPLKRFNEWIQ